MFLDIVIIVIFAVSAIMGYRKGLIGQIGSVAAIIIGILACRMFGPQVTDMIMPAGNADPATDPNSMPRYVAVILAYSGVYIVAYYAVILVARLLRTVTHTLLLGPLDRMAGAVVSVVKWFLAVSVAMNLYIAIFSPADITHSTRVCGERTVTWILNLAPTVWGAFTQHNTSTQHGS
ncbi:CvpA family protein [uncultured Duncaniella sp.]|jgi:membrane protein required for colicin V production|uniref:CvpA family protein n=1 Tax=uncultured Duncaniella sp. TaxID=2768039 RepID=UPI00267606EA|nr:CvpA family protein [uncultured Duncaniella sp.]MCI9172155.1 CvpA family protein [Muribaculaceae bacterium]